MKQNIILTLTVFIMLILFPGKNIQEKEVCFEAPKLAYNSFKKISYFPAICLLIHFIKPVPNGLWKVHEKINIAQLYIFTNNAAPINFETSIIIKNGYTKIQILKLINECSNLSGQLIQDLDEGEICAQTYHFKKGTQRIQIINLAKKHMKILVDALWDNRPYDFSLTKKEWIILASIVEKEGKTKEDFVKIASCFLTRLKKKMYLGSCATVLYGLNKTGKKNYLKYLKIQTQFNTYKNKGLPPKAICIPSNNALEAVLEAKNNSQYLYFYYDKKLIMSKTLNEHIKVKNKAKIIR